MLYNVLIVDDEEIVCRGLSKFVKWQEHGFYVAGMAFQVKDALAILASVQIHVVFTDVRMSGDTGLELLQIIKEHYTHIKTVMISGYSEFEYVQQALRLGAVDYLTKPANLKEITQLLDRLRNILEQESLEKEIRDNRIEALLLSIAKGYTMINDTRTALPVIHNFYGIRLDILEHYLTKEELTLKKQTLKDELKTIYPDIYILNNEVYELFILLLCEDKKEIEPFIDAVTEAYPIMRYCAAGISKMKHGIDQLKDAYMESGRALRYQRAKECNGLIYYKHVETVFSKYTPEIYDIIKQLITGLNNPDCREAAVRILENNLIQLEESHLSLMEIQTACILCLIELNDFLQNLQLKDADLHKRLNRTLHNLLLCNNFSDTNSCMVHYIREIVPLINAMDTVWFKYDIIKEVQLFIQEHYQHNITLNVLAEHFYLHPNYLSRLFKEKSGKNFSDFIMEVRMEKAKELLCSHDNKVLEISSLAGYDNPRYFSKVFKQYTGMTPSEYRESCMNRQS